MKMTRRTYSVEEHHLRKAQKRAKKEGTNMSAEIRKFVIEFAAKK